MARGLGDGPFAAREVARGALEAIAAQIGADRDAGGPAEAPREVAGTDRERLGEVGHAQGLLQMLAGVTRHPADKLGRAGVGRGERNGRAARRIARVEKLPQQERRGEPQAHARLVRAASDRPLPGLQDRLERMARRRGKAHRPVPKQFQRRAGGQLEGKKEPEQALRVGLAVLVELVRKDEHPPALLEAHELFVEDDAAGGLQADNQHPAVVHEIGRASCRERV